jgi:hypothetical protein
VLNEYQDIQSLRQHGVDVQEVDGDDPGGLGVQELPPGWARAARRRADACSSQDLIDGGGRDRDAELGQLAVGDAADRWRAAGLAPSTRNALLNAVDQVMLSASFTEHHRSGKEIVIDGVEAR